MANKKNNATKIIAACIPLVLIIAIVVVLIFTSKNNNSASNSSDSSSSSSATANPNIVTPTGDAIASDGGVNVNKALGIASSGENMVNMDIYFDYMCPFCGVFERGFENIFTSAIKDKKLNLTLHPMNMLDASSSGTKYSTRATNALYTIAVNEPQYLWAFSQGLMANQPDEGSEGLSDAQLVQIAQSVGVSDSVTSQFTALIFENAISEYTNNIMDMSGFQGTPDVRVGLAGKTPESWDGWGDARSGSTSIDEKKAKKVFNQMLADVIAGKSLS